MDFRNMYDYFWKRFVDILRGEMYEWAVDLIVIIYILPYKEVPATFPAPVISSDVFVRCAVPIWLELK